MFRYLKGQPKLGLWYPKDSPFDLEAYTDSDYAGASLDRKSTIGAIKDRIEVNTGNSSVNAAGHYLVLPGRYVHDTEINTASTSFTTASINITTVELVTTVSTPITTAGVSTLIKIRSGKSKEKAKERGSKGETSETTTRPIVPLQQKLNPKDKGKGKTVEPEKPLKKKDQIEFDKEVSQRLQAQFKEEERMERQQEEDANIAKWDDVQAMIDADHELAERLQAKEQGELTIEEWLKLFLKNKSFNEVQKAFDNTMIWINLFIPMDSEVMKDRAEGSDTRAKGSSKRAGKELESDKSKKQKLDENVEAKVDNDQEEAAMKIYMKVVSDDEVAIDAIHLATKPSIIVDWKIIKEGKISSYHIIRSDGSSKTYSSMIQMLQNIDREDLETLWKLVKAKYGNTRP
nr:uncharacterized mitochondrial protein AtMg00810-like [Tanacetum cinerariifolium]